MRLWEREHPYYMSEGCYHKGGCLENFESFDAFLEDWGKQDVDLNRIHRWDFIVSDEGKLESLDLYYVMQRKAFTYSVHVKVKESDEDRIREFLKPYAELNLKLWDGIL